MLFGGKIELGRGPYLSRAVRPLLHRPHAARRADRRRQRRPRGQPLHRPEHRGHADRRRGDRVQGRHRDRPGQRDRRQGAAGRHPGDRVHFIVKADKPFFVEPLFTRDPAADHRRPDPDRDAGDQGHLRALWRAAAQSRHRLQHRRDRAAAADLRREAGPEGQDRHPLRAESRIPR